MAFSPDHHTVAIAEDDNSLRLVDFESGATSGFLRGHAVKISTVAFSPDGLRVATGGWTDRSIRIWDLKSRRQLSLTDVPRRCSGLAFSPDGRSLLSAHFDRRFIGLMLWDLTLDNSLKNTKVVDLRSVSNQPQPTRLLRFSPDGRWLAFGQDVVHVLHISDGEVKRFDGEGKLRSTIVSYLFLGDRGWLVSATHHGELTVWSFLTGTKVFSLPTSGSPIIDTRITSMSRVPGTDTVVTGSEWNSVTLWDLRIRKVQRTLPLRLPIDSNHRLHQSDLIFSDDGEGLAVKNDQKIYLFDFNKLSQP